MEVFFFFFFLIVPGWFYFVFFVWYDSSRVGVIITISSVSCDYGMKGGRGKKKAHPFFPSALA